MLNKQKLVISREHYNNLYVAVEGAIGDWACYVGKKSDSEEQVRRYGDKISEAEARRLFPEFKRMQWRP